MTQKDSHTDTSVLDMMSAFNDLQEQIVEYAKHSVIDAAGLGLGTIAVDTRKLKEGKNKVLLQTEGALQAIERSEQLLECLKQDAMRSSPVFSHGEEEGGNSNVRRQFRLSMRAFNAFKGDVKGEYNEVQRLLNDQFHSEADLSAASFQSVALAVCLLTRSALQKVDPENHDRAPG